MAIKRATYIEPEDYFTPGMRKIVENAQKNPEKNKTTKTTGKTAGKKK